jgi:hypothetical protein
MCTSTSALLEECLTKIMNRIRVGFSNRFFYRETPGFFKTGESTKTGFLVPV